MGESICGRVFFVKRVSPPSVVESGTGGAFEDRSEDHLSICSLRVDSLCAHSIQHQIH